MNSSFQSNPAKLYIQDIFRAQRTTTNKYTYEIFGMTFKNVMLHGVVTGIYTNNDKVASFDLTDSTGTIQAYYDKSKSNNNIPGNTMKEILHEYICGGDRNPIMNKLKDRIVKEVHINIEQGDYVSVVGDIFLDGLKGLRMLSVYELKATSIEYDVVWLTELQYLYEKYYLWTLQ